ncbi:MAG: aminoacyl-tRNA hydrolase [Rikenellaceae bacterium]|nr:aminoacyl-tRNA hydrolase [Rikenellaceae bacterium]
MKYLIAGLGNIGAKYADTRHNIGFRVVDALAAAAGATFATDRYGSVAEIRHKGRILLLLKPSTYMNLSGKAVSYWLQRARITPENLLVVLDDIALPFGAVRLRGKGSDGGHNGLKNINLILGNGDYARLRFGVGGDFPKGYQIDHVLGQWSDDEARALPERIDMACDAVRTFAASGINAAMNLYNNR